MSFISPLELKLLAHIGCTPADGVRALRPGGPADVCYYSTHCPGCGQRVTESIRWFMLHEYRCGCGSEFDLSDYRLWQVALLRQDYAAARAITSITERPSVEGHTDGHEE